MNFVGRYYRACNAVKVFGLGSGLSLFLGVASWAAPAVSDMSDVIAPSLPASSSALLRAQSQSVPTARPQGGERIVVAQNFFQRLFGLGNNGKKKKAPSGKSKAGAKGKRGGWTPPAVQTIPKDPDAAVIAVFGDEFSQDIAFGLREAFAKVPDVRVDVHSVRNSGLQHRAKRNPLANLAPLIDKKPFNFAVVMVGLNDRRKFRAEKNEEGEIVREAIEFQEPGWEALYAKRIDAIRMSLEAKEKPLYWVGLPPVKSPKMTEELNYLNDIIRSRMIEREERFIDIWDAFSNENGDYVRRGPDLSGQDKNLRHKTGVRFTKAGRRKLAFFVEKLVIRALSQSVDETALPDLLSSADESALKEGRGANRGIFVVRQPPVDATKLVTPNGQLAQKDEAGTKNSSINPGAKAPALRVDHFAWPSPAQ